MKQKARKKQLRDIALKIPAVGSFTKWCEEVDDKEYSKFGE